MDLIHKKEGTILRKLLKKKLAQVMLGNWKGFLRL